MAFPIGLIFTGASFLLDRLPGLLSNLGMTAPSEAVDGAKLLVALGPKAIQLMEDVNNGVAPAVIQERWNEAKAAVEAGNAAWEAAKGETDGA